MKNYGQKKSGMPSKQSLPLIKINQYNILAILFWIVVWQIAAMIINKEMFLASPLAVVGALCNLIRMNTFWISLSHSFIKIVSGFVLGIVIGTLLAVLSYKNRICKELMEPLMKVIKSIPVASFIILALLWISSANLSILISFLMVIPIVYTNILQGLYHVDSKLLEMAQVYQIGWYKTIKYLYIPDVMPYFISACSIGLGFCWKAGIAAEVIGLPKNSIGESLYEAKLYLMTKELFAWTIVIIIISVVFEKVVMAFLKWIQKLIIGTNMGRNGDSHEY